MTKFVCCCSNFFGFPRHEQFACVSPWASSPWPVCVGSTSRMWIQRMALAARWWWLLKWENIRVISLENICSCYPQWHREHPPSFPAQSWAPYLHNLMSNIYWNMVILSSFFAFINYFLKWMHLNILTHSAHCDQGPPHSMRNRAEVIVGILHDPATFNRRCESHHLIWCWQRTSLHSKPWWQIWWQTLWSSTTIRSAPEWRSVRTLG